jgi:hypothetical protein
MKQLLFFLLLSLPFWVEGQTIVQSMYFPRIGWRIDIPGGYTISDTLAGASTWDKMVKDPSGSRTYPNNSLFSIKDEKSDFIGAYLIPFESKKDGDWSEFVRKNDEKWYTMLKYDGVQSDSASGEEVISGQRFEKFYICQKMGGKTLINIILLNKQFGRYCLRIYMSYSPRGSAEQLLTILQRSSFKKTE